MSARYAFGPFVVDLHKRLLWRDGHLLAITSKTFDVLAVLIERRDHNVGKDELMARVWPDTAVNENNLARQVSSLRRALGQRPDQHDVIVTIPGHGYRFVASVRELEEPPAEAPAPAAPPEDPAAGGRAGAGNAAGAAASAGPTRRGWIQAGILTAAAAAITAVAVDVMVRRAGTAPQARRALHRVTYDEASVPRDAAWSPDGRHVVYTSDRAGNADLWTQRLGDPDPVRLTRHDAGESQPQWSPDGRWIVFRSERHGGGIFVIPASGGDERPLAGFGYEPRWSPDGGRVLFKGSTVLPDVPAVYVVGLDGAPARPVRPDVLGRFTALQAAWHPDGRRISIWGTTRQRESQFLTVPLDGGAPAAAGIDPQVRLDLAGIAPCQFVWAPSRRYIYFEGRIGDTANIWRLTVDPATERWVGGPERLTTGGGEETHVALSPDGSRLVFTSTSARTRIWSFPFDPALGRTTGDPHPLSHAGTGEVDFDARADGSKVAYRTVRAGRSELWERSVDDAQPRLLLSSASWAMAKPLWSPDGGRLAFLRWQPSVKNYGLALINADGTGERPLTLPGRVEMLGSDWSKDGEALLGSCRFSQADRYSTCLVQVSSVNDSGVSPVKVLASDPRRNLFNQRFSPDQRWITFLAHDLSSASTSTVYVAPAAGGAWRAITDGSWFDDKPRFGPDGRTLYFVSNRSGVRNVWGRRFDPVLGVPVGDAFPVTAFRAAPFLLSEQSVQMEIAITPTQLLLPMSESRSEIWMLDQVDR
jgi:Tol biopolymer transport system component/DNA-binding winged helix-turn-helix (wHTH) protein